MNKTAEKILDLDVTAIQKKMANSQFDEVLTNLHQVLEKDTSHADANYLAAVCYRYKNDHHKAQQYLNTLKELALDKGRVYQEQGHLYRAQGLVTQALTAYQAACQLNPALIASWQMQAELFESLEKPAEAQQATMQLQRLQTTPKVLISVMDLISQGKIVKAESLCKNFLKKFPTNAEAMRLLASIAMRLGAMDETEFLLESAIKFEPENVQVQIDYITALRRRQKFEASIGAAKNLLDKDANNPQFQSVYAIAKMQMGEYEQAIALFDKVLERLPNDPVTHTSKGHALKTWGKNSAAIDSYKNALKNNADYCEAYYALSNLKTYKFDDNEIEDMRMLESKESLTPANYVNLYFALGKAYEDKRDWGLSFEYYQKGNRIKKQQSSYDAAKMSDELRSQRQFFSAEKTDQLCQWGYPDESPIFIVGLPRAGSTLLEQILSSHSMVDGTLELPNMLSIAQMLRRSKRGGDKHGYPEIIASLSPEELHTLGKQYIDETKIHRHGAAFFIDKMPNNFRHIGLIKTILPNAKIIDARRHPVACCFSGFKQLFAEGQEFSYSLDDIAQYYNDYVELMNHWDKVLPGSVLRVNYEQVIDDLESQVRRILDYCGLPFETSCLEFHKTKRAVRTASSEQVRKPIYKSGVDQWRNFEHCLQPLIKNVVKHHE